MVTNLQFDITYNTKPKLVLNSSELLGGYLFGVPICNHQGYELTDDIINNKILASQQWLENILYIKLNEQIIRETTNFIKNEWDSWGFVKTTYNVKKAMQLEGFYNKIKQIVYPTEWLNVRFEQSSLENDRDVTFRQVFIVPSGTTGQIERNGIIFNGVTPFIIYTGRQFIPNYWAISYMTGFKVIPKDILDVIAKLAAIQLLLMLGDTYGAIGQSSYSVSLDGLSQNSSFIKSGEYGIWGSRIKQYTTDIFGINGVGGQLEALKAKYRGITFDVL